ncbi:MAG: adenosylcobinamide-GDP ribazoletransferase [Salinispira sp.]
MIFRKFLSALMFYTRIPVPHSCCDLNAAETAPFLPLIGFLVGGISAGVWFAAALFLPHSVAVVMSMIVSVLLTGAFHEDGFADSCDGIYGGFTVHDRLRIMKDSRVGAYALVGTVLLILLKYTLLREIPVSIFPVAVIMAQVLSRLVPVYLMRILRYVREDGTSKIMAEIAPGTEPMDGAGNGAVDGAGAGAVDGADNRAGNGAGIGKVSLPGIVGATLFSTVLIAVLSYVSNSWYLLCVLIVVPVLTALSARYFYRKLGGYTGDILGASQQLAEAGVLAALLVLWRYLP